MQWYEDQAYISWQGRDGTHTKYLERAMRYAKHQVQGDGEGPRKFKNEVISAAAQLHSEYSVWIASMMVERQRCILYAQLVARHSLDADKEGKGEDDRLKITASIALRLAGDLHRAKHWSNVWREIEPKPDVQETEDQV